MRERRDPQRASKKIFDLIKTELAFVEDEFERQASSNIQLTFSTLSGIADQALFLTDLLAFFEMRPTIQSKPDALPAPRPIVRGFEFRNVSFRYPGSSRRVLDGLNFHLRPGERVALIGENGEGIREKAQRLARNYRQETAEAERFGSRQRRR